MKQKLVVKKKAYRMTRVRHNKLVKELAEVINRNRFENYIGMPDYAIAEEMLEAIYKLKKYYNEGRFQ
jgi:hypothetical protein